MYSYLRCFMESMMPVKKVDFKTKEPNPSLAGVVDISVDEVNQLRKQVLLVDVRRPDEWTGEFGHIEEAQLMTLDTIPMRLQELPRDQTIVFVCRSGARSANAAAFARENGITDVYNMKGGMIAWTEKKFPSIEVNGED